jgi:hypothetical protein
MSKKKDGFFNANGLPEFCYAYMPSDPDQVTLIKRGEHGYFPSKYTGGKAKAIELNADLGVSEVQMECMMAGSMFSWNCPAAFPKLRDEKGELELNA